MYIVQTVGSTAMQCCTNIFTGIVQLSLNLLFLNCIRVCVAVLVCCTVQWKCNKLNCTLAQCTPYSAEYVGVGPCCVLALICRHKYADKTGESGDQRRKYGFSLDQRSVRRCINNVTFGIDVRRAAVLRPWTMSFECHKWGCWLAICSHHESSTPTITDTTTWQAPGNSLIWTGRSSTGRLRWLQSCCSCGPSLIVWSFVTTARSLRRCGTFPLCVLFKSC